jgi:hypothetical protein
MDRTTEKVVQLIGTLQLRIIELETALEKALEATRNNDSPYPENPELSE